MLIADDFDRAERDDAKEQVGGGWGTNSKSRTGGNKQVDLRDGALHIVRHAAADHGVSVTHEAAFADAVLTLRFKLDGKGDDLGVNVADMSERSVHAGHLFVTRVRLNRLELTDLKTGLMNLALREKRLAGTLSAAEAGVVGDEAGRVPAGPRRRRMARPGGADRARDADGEDRRGGGRGRSPRRASATRPRPACGWRWRDTAWVDDVRLVRLDGGGAASGTE